MATKKASKAAPAGKKTGKSLTVFEERMRQRANMAAAVEENVGSGGAFISLKGGRLAFQGAEIPGNKMNVVIVDHILEYVFYGDRYDPDNPAPPIAFALGRDEKELRWHENSIPEYNGEAIAGELCKDSEINQWGSADTGSGKAAKNQRRLALLTEDQIADAETIENATVAFLKVPVTSVKAWAGYVRQLQKTLERPTLAVVTEISVVPDSKTQFKLQFKLVEQIDDPEILEALFEKADVVEKEIDFPYPPYDEEAQEERPARGRGKTSRGRDAKPARNTKPARREEPAQERSGRGGKATGKPAKRKY